MNAYLSFSFQYRGQLFGYLVYLIVKSCMISSEVHRRAQYSPCPSIMIRVVLRFLVPSVPFISLISKTMNRLANMMVQTTTLICVHHHLLLRHPRNGGVNYPASLVFIPIVIPLQNPCDLTQKYGKANFTKLVHP